MQSFNLIWQNTLIYLEENLPKIQYDTWIKELKPIFTENDTFYFETTGDMHTRRINESLIDNIYGGFIRSYRNILGAPPEELDLKFLSPKNAAELLYKKRQSAASEKKASETNPEIALNPEYTFKTFVVGDSNKFANAVAHSVAENPGFAHNPLFLYGGVGLGKTHLMHAIGNEIKKTNPEANVLYVTADNFMNQVITMIQYANKNINTRVKFQNKYRNADVLMIDDIQSISNSEKTQNEIFHTFNALHELNKQVIISSDRPPHELTELEERLRSRLEWGGPIDIKPPDFETRIAILKTKINSIKERENIPLLEISDDAYRYIAERQNANIRTLEGVLNRVVAYTKTIKTNTVDLDFAKEALFNYLPDSEKEPPTSDFITETVCRRYNISKNDILGSKRSRDIAYPRQIAMYLIRDIIESSYEKIAEYFHKNDHTTVRHAVMKIKEKLDTDDELKEEIKNLKAKIMGL